MPSLSDSMKDEPGDKTLTTDILNVLASVKSDDNGDDDDMPPLEPDHYEEAQGRWGCIPELIAGGIAIDRWGSVAGVGSVLEAHEDVNQCIDGSSTPGGSSTPVGNVTPVGNAAIKWTKDTKQLLASKLAELATGVFPDSTNAGQKGARVWVDRILEECVENENGNFSTRGAMASRWNRYLDHPAQKEMKKKYQAVSNTLKKRMRCDWSKERFDDLKVTKEYKEVHERIEIEKGQYMPLTLVVQAEGGPFGWDDEEAVRAACLYASKCTVMGHPWIEWNGMTERIEYLYMKKEVRDIFKRSWIRTESSMSDASKVAEQLSTTSLQAAGGLAQPNSRVTFAAATAAADTHLTPIANRREAPAVDNTSLTPIPKAQSVASETPIQVGKETPGGKKEKGKEKQPVTDQVEADASVSTISKSEANSANSKAKRTCSPFRTLTTNYDSLIHQIKNEEDWQWARQSSTLIESLEQTHKEVMSKVTPFVRDMISLPAADLKRKYHETDLELQMANICDILDKPLSNLNGEMVKLVKMQSARVADDRSKKIKPSP
jgi:hypothetical protein